MNDRKNKLIRAVIVLIGIGILVYPSLGEFLQQRNASRAIAVYEDTVNTAKQTRLDQMLEDAREYNRILASSVSAKRDNSDTDADPVTLDSYEQLLDINGDGMMGYIIIPKLNITDRIFHGTEESVLQVGVGHMPNTSLPVGGETTHAVLSGHRGLPSADLFTDLDRLEIGDTFYIKILDKTLCYTVDQILTVLPDETEELKIQEGKDYVTLITCTPYGVNSHRLLVRGIRTPFDDTKEVVISDNNSSSFWLKLPVQYRHMLIGVCAIAVFFFFWYLIRFLISKAGKRNSE